MVFAFCVLFVVAAATRAQSFVRVYDGVEHAVFTRNIAGINVRINLIRLDLSKVRLDAARAMDAAIGTEKTSSIAARRGALAAINAGFFRLDTSVFAGDSAGVSVIDKVLYSESINSRVALLIENAGRRSHATIERIDVASILSIAGKDLPVGINRERSAADIVVYTNVFHRTTLTDRSGVEFVVWRGRVTKIFDRRGSTAIPVDGYIISASGEKRQRLLSMLKVGTLIKLRSSYFRAGGGAIAPPETIVGGAPQLVKDGQISVTWQEEKTTKAFVETRHPRTAVATLSDGRLLMLTADGRSESSGGIGLYDLAALLVELKAVNAMNLDGGGSTTMLLGGKIINTPSDKEGERKVSDAIIVMPRRVAKANLRFPGHRVRLRQPFANPD